MRKSRAKKRILLPDPKFGDKLVTRFVNTMMLSGKKTIAFIISFQTQTNWNIAKEAIAGRDKGTMMRVNI